MKRIGKNITLLISVLLVITVCAVFALIHLNRVPVRISQDEAALDLERKCYLIEPNSREILGESILTANGKLNKEGGFVGTMNVAQYPIPAELIDGNISGEITEDFLLLSCQALALSQDGHDTIYNVTIARSNTDIVVIYIYHMGSTITAVCAETEEAAWANFDAYIELLRTE